MVEETAIRLQINAAKFAGQGIFGILQAVASMLQARQYFGHRKCYGAELWSAQQSDRLEQHTGRLLY